MSRNWVSHTPDDKVPQDSSHNKRTQSSSGSSKNSRNRISKRSSPCSPPTPYEKFFLPFEDQSEFFLAATCVSATNSYYNYLPFFGRSSQESLASESVRTEEFSSVVEDFESVLSETDFDDISIERNIYKDDILGLTTKSITEEMASKSKKKVKAVMYEAASDASSPNVDPAVNMQEEEEHSSPTMTETSVDTPTVVKDSSPHYDVVDHVYEGAKTAWAMGKDVAIFNVAILKPFMGVAEGVATKILSVATGVDSLDTVDKSIKPHLKGIDHDLVDPAILRLWSILGPIFGKGDEIVKGVVNMVKKPLIKCKAEEAV
jgi:hypothetical protein